MISRPSANDAKPLQGDEEPLSRERAVILYADVANYSGLCAIDEDGTHGRLDQYLNIFAGSVEEHAGRVHHFAGDALLATFDGAAAAVACAVAVQRELIELNESVAASRRVEFRVGINEGNVIHGRGDVFGEALRVKPDLTLDAYLATQPYAGHDRLEELGDRLRWAGLP